MSVTITATAVCDRCRIAETRKQAETFTPAAWRTLKIGYYSSTAFCPQMTRLLCDTCTGLIGTVLEQRGGVA